MSMLPSLCELRIVTTSYGQHDNVHTFLTQLDCFLNAMGVGMRFGSWTEGEQEELMELTPTLICLVLNT